MKSSKTVFCVWIVLCVAHHGVATTTVGNSFVTEIEYFTEITEITQVTTTLYEDPTTGSILETSLEDDRRETNTTGNSTFGATTPAFSNSSGSNSTYDLLTVSESQTENKQTTMTTGQISTIADFGGNSGNTTYPDPKTTYLDTNTTYYMSSVNFFTNPGVAYGPTSTTDNPATNGEEKVFGSKVVFTLIAIVAVLGAIFISFLLVKLSKYIKRSKRSKSKKSKRKRSWKRARTTISDTYFTIMSGMRPPLPPRNARKNRGDDDDDDVEQPYHVPVLFQHPKFKNPNENKFQTMVYQNSEDLTNQMPPGNYVRDDLKPRDDLHFTTSMVIHNVENIYETTFHNNGFSRIDDDLEISPPNPEDPSSENGPTDDESRAVKRYISMRCRPNAQDELQRSSACSDDSSKAGIDGEQVIDEYINQLWKSTNDCLGPRSPEYNTYDSVPYPASLQNTFRFPKSDSEHIVASQSGKEKSFPSKEDIQDLDSPDYNTLQFQKLPEESQKYASYLPKNDDVIRAALNGHVAGGKPIIIETTSSVPSLETHVNELENEYTLDPTTQSIDNTMINNSQGRPMLDIKNNAWKQRGISWRV